MNKHTDKYLDDLSKKIIKNALTKKPSLDFTSSVMTQISELKTSTITYKPLISKKGWFMVSAFIILLVLFIVNTNGSVDSSSYMNSLDFSILSDNKLFSMFRDISVSKTFVYTVVLFGIMFSVQVALLKSHFNKRLS